MARATKQKTPKSHRRAKTKHNGASIESSFLLPIGHGGYVAIPKLIAILNPNSSPLKRLVHEAKKAKTLKDATHGRHNRSVLIMENGDIILSALNPETMAQRFQDYLEASRK